MYWKMMALLLWVSVAQVACAQPMQEVAQDEAQEFERADKVIKTAESWKETLTDMQYHVLREHGTERPFTGKLLKNKKRGVYSCAGCGLPLFSSETKFKSGTGWPSFYDVIKDENVGEIADGSLGMMRVEVRCTRCDGHLGHVFEDGPAPTGLRYCINSAALEFEKKK